MCIVFPCLLTILLVIGIILIFIYQPTFIWHTKEIKYNHE